MIMVVVTQKNVSEFSLAILKSMLTSIGPVPEQDQ